MGQEYIKILKKGNKAFRQQKSSQASELFTEVLAEAKRNLRQVMVLSKDNVQTIQEFCLCSRAAGNALLKDGRVAEAGRIYLTAGDKLKPFISNLNNPLPCRALVMTEFKSLFYELVELYISNGQLDRLNTYVEKNTPMLKKWAGELQMSSQPAENLN